MRRVWRFILNAFTILSLALCLATVVLWVRSYRASDQIVWRNDRGWRSIRSARGYVDVGLLWADWSGHPREFHGPRYGRGEPYPPSNWLMEMNGERGDTLTSWERAGFAWHERRNRRRGTLHAIAVIPFWALAAITAATPLARAATRIRRHAARAARRDLTPRCTMCGYDLRATPDRCPECGRIAEDAVAARRPSH